VETDDVAMKKIICESTTQWKARL